MPTYEYECLNCGAHFEAFQKMSDLPLDSCIECQGSVRRIISGGTGLIFKGSGFYITDYAKGKNKPKESTPSKAKTTDSAKTKSTPKKKTSSQDQ